MWVLLVLDGWFQGRIRLFRDSDELASDVNTPLSDGDNLLSGSNKGLADQIAPPGQGARLLGEGGDRLVPGHKRLSVIGSQMHL
jgi:hypothetical protein